MLLKKRSALVMVMVCYSLSACAPVNNKNSKDAWFGPDKAKHFVVAATIGAGTSMILKRKGRGDCLALAGGASMSVVLGLGKEYHDKYNRKTAWSWKDMFWNLLGGMVGSLAATGCH